jgi:hypothetical protein
MSVSSIGSLSEPTSTLLQGRNSKLKAKFEASFAVIKRGQPGKLRVNLHHPAILLISPFCNQ